MTDRLIQDGPVAARGPAPASMRTITDVESLTGVEAGWDELVRAMRRPSPFMLHAWLRNWSVIADKTGQLAVQVAHRDGQLVGALPFVTHSHFGMKVASFIGGHCAPLGDVLLAPGEPEETGRALVDRARGGEQQLVDFFGLSGHSLLGTLVPGDDLRLVRRVDAPVLDLSAGWDEVYKSKTSSKTRNLHRRRRRQLGELGKLETETARTADELDSAITDAFHLHQLRWAGRPDGSNFASPKGQIFHRAAIRELAAMDIPRIVLLKLDGRAIAFHYYFAFCGRMYVHRLAFDPELSRYSPGLVNTLDAIQIAAEEGLTLVEYLGGAERYKVDLSDERDPLYQAIGMATSPVGKAAAALHTQGIETRNRLRESKTLRNFYFEGLAPARVLLGRVRNRGMQ